MFRRNPFNTTVALAAVVFIVSGICLVPIPVAVLSKNLLANSEFRDGGAS